MSPRPRFKKAYPYQKDVLALPVTDLDSASRWYCEHFGMVEVERLSQPVPTVILERDGTRLGFAINGGDPAQALPGDVAEFLVGEHAHARLTGCPAAAFREPSPGAGRGRRARGRAGRYG